LQIQARTCRQCTYLPYVLIVVQAIP
jgi:hypothetical protein